MCCDLLTFESHSLWWAKEDRGEKVNTQLWAQQGLWFSAREQVMSLEVMISTKVNGGCICSGWGMRRVARLASSEGSSAPKQGKLLCADATFSREKSCTGNKQLFDDILNLYLHGQQAYVLFKATRYWRDLGDKHPITYDSYKPSNFAEEAIYFHAQLFIIKMCFGSERVPASRVLHFLIIFILKICTSWPCTTEWGCSLHVKGLQHISATSGDCKTQ